MKITDLASAGWVVVTAAVESGISCRPEMIMMAEAPLGWGDLKQKRGALMFALEDSR